MPIELFSEVFACPICGAASWSGGDHHARTCCRCGYVPKISGRHIRLLPTGLSDNNARELAAYNSDQPGQAEALLNYSIRKPWNYPAAIRDVYLRQVAGIAEIANGLGPEPSVLFVFGGGGMEAHLSGLLGPRTVIADISLELLMHAEKRFDHYGLEQPIAFVQCDAERLPFKDASFDLVIGFEGIHHCMVPQAALQEIWRVARRRTYIVDNYECALTNMLERFALSSRLEGSGVKPNRFSRVALETMLFNAKIPRYEFLPRAVLPNGVTLRLGGFLSRLLTRVMEAVWQTNMFILATYRD
jgi:SAM-dependent methyltransferase